MQDSKNVLSHRDNIFFGLRESKIDKSILFSEDRSTFNEKISFVHQVKLESLLDVIYIPILIEQPINYI